jgi:glucosamine--fructose-6-phosphate aminotransferase (isomerizing)
VCGIIAILRAPQAVEALDPAPLIERLNGATSALEAADPAQWPAIAEELAAVNRQLRGVPGLLLLCSPDGAGLRGRIETMSAALEGIEARVEELLAGHSGDDLEHLNATLGAVRDQVWAIGRDRLRAADGSLELAGDGAGPAALTAMFSLHQALSALDRLEVRGRDSAGVELTVTGHGLDLDGDVAAEIERRRDPLFQSGSVERRGDSLVFVYKAAAEIGELGDNTAALRSAVRGDELLRRALRAPGATAQVLGHTRWASIGIISESNAHPQCSTETAGSGSLVTAVLNGDVDNFADLIAADDLDIPTLITTDAKVIPTLTSRALERGVDPRAAFRDSVARMEGSVAIAAAVADEPDVLRLALRGSGQALYVGLADHCYIVASEPYGIVEETDCYLRMDGETPADPANPTGSRGQLVELRAAAAGSIAGISRWSYDGTELPVTDADLDTAQITTRDIDRGDAPHYLLKEISDAPGSFRKTLRNKLVRTAAGYDVVLSDDQLPADIAADLANGSINRVLVIGQGTAAAAGESLALILTELVADSDLWVEAVLATELSGFRLRPHMSDTLIVAVSQSGTTTDTNRTVDLARQRGARVIAIVNRRNSDLCDKSDGVLFTSDGRDVEMSVASTKAFYSQIAAGLLLAVGIARHVPRAVAVDTPDQQRLLAELALVPEHLETVLATRAAIGEVARQFCPSKRYWAIVGNGPNRIAARELRIKLSELCYKSIALDATEDKKHIDLSSEPLILVCMAGLMGSTADDVAKEVAIYKAHKASPVVIATEGSAPPAALAVLSVPDTDPRLAFIFSAMVGHLFGYEAALAIDAQANPLRAARASVEALSREVAAGDLQGDALLHRVRQDLAAPAGSFADGLRSGAYNGHLEASTAVRLSGLLRYAVGSVGLGSYQAEFGKVGTPGVLIDDLLSALTAAVEELTRPIDAIKHQAKTVTVGISRSDESLLQIPLVAAALAAGAPRDRLAYAVLRMLGDLDPAIVEVTGSTRYRIEWLDDDDEATATVIDRQGIAVNIASRTDKDHRLRGTKHLVAREQVPMVSRGGDGRMVLSVPETKDGVTTGLTLLHLKLVDHLPGGTVRAVLQGYRSRYQSLRELVTERHDSFREDLLADQPIADLLCEPLIDLAERWD